MLSFWMRGGIYILIVVCSFGGALRAEGVKGALLLGVSQYDTKELDNLPFAEKDIADLSTVLTERMQFRKENVRVLSRSRAFATRNLKWLPTAKSIRREIRLLIDRAEKDDTILFAFAGHGVQFQNDKETWFCPSDAVLNNRKTLIGLKGEVYELLEKRCKARVKLLFVDACRNDPRSATSRGRREVNIRKINRPQDLQLPKGIAAFFSCRSGQQSFEHKPLGHGVFFHFLIEGLKGGAADSKGQITLPSLRLYVKKKVVDYVDQKLDAVQTPELLESSEDIIILSRGKPQQKIRLHSATIPVSRSGSWLKRHQAYVQMAKRGRIEVLFLGDSLTDAWGGEGHSTSRGGAEIFKREFAPLGAANFGIAGDRTQHVLWRLQNGELKGIQPKVVMLMIGTNNSIVNTAEEIAEGITAIVQEIHKQSPRTKVLLLGIFPRGPKPDKRREINNKANQIISKLDDGGKTVKYLDIGKRFMKRDGSITREIMPDYLHLSTKGYRIWADAVKGPIKDLLRSTKGS